MTVTYEIFLMVQVFPMLVGMGSARRSRAKCRGNIAFAGAT
jgi:hypothetical protein